MLALHKIQQSPCCEPKPAAPLRHPHPPTTATTDRTHLAPGEPSHVLEMASALDPTTKELSHLHTHGPSNCSLNTTNPSARAPSMLQHNHQQLHCTTSTFACCELQQCVSTLACGYRAHACPTNTGITLDSIPIRSAGSPCLLRQLSCPLLPASRTRMGTSPRLYRHCQLLRPTSTPAHP